MAIKWGSTDISVIKWGNTTCTKVYWGSTLVYPNGGYDGSSFSYPLSGGVKWARPGAQASTTNITSGTISFSFSADFRKDNRVSYLASISSSIDFSKFTKIKIQGSASTTNSNVNSPTYCDAYAMNFDSSGYWTNKVNIGYCYFNSEKSFSITKTGALGLEFSFYTSKIVSATCTVNITKIDLY